MTGYVLDKQTETSRWQNANISDMLVSTDV